MANQAEDDRVVELSRLFAQSHKHPGDNAIEERAIQAAVDFIHEHGDETHLFCNRTLYSASIHALVLFALGEEDNVALDWYKEKLCKCLDSCTRCIALFHRGRARLMETFLTERGICYNNVNILSKTILQWEATRLTSRFRRLVGENDIKMGVPRELLTCFAECMCGPQLLVLNSELRGLFAHLLLQLLASDHSFVKTATVVTPGLVYLAIEGDDTEKKWACQMLKDLGSTETQITAAQVQPDLLEEIEIELRTVEIASRDKELKRERFYRGMCALFEALDQDAIMLKVLQIGKSRPVDVDRDDPILPSIFETLRDHVMSYPDQSLPYILRFLGLLLGKVGEKFWSHIGQYTFQNIMGPITQNPNLIKNLSILRDTPSFAGELNPEARISDLLDWIDNFLSSLSTSQRIKSVETLTMYLITQVESQQSIPLDVKAKMFVKACTILSSALSLPSQLYSPSLTTDLLARGDTRVVVDTKLIRFFDYGTSQAIFFPEYNREKNAQVMKSAIEVICKALRFDILTFAQNSYEIQKGKKPSTLKFSPLLLEAISKQQLNRQLEMSFQLLCSMENVSTILPVGAHVEEVKMFMRYLSQFFVKFSDIDARNTKMILSNPRSLKGYWACVFSPDEGVYQSAVDILYETFDAAGRLEGVHDLLQNNISCCLQAINDNLTNLIFIEFYEPCPRAVKVLTDVIQGLNSPVDGIFGESETFDKATKQSLFEFWNRCWKFLDLIYVETLKWAEKYPDLVEFTRDTLDLSHAVLGCFKTIKELDTDGDSKKVFNEITNTFPHMLVWLRLSDPGLLSSCVKLIFSTLDIASDLSYKLDTNVIELLAKYACKAKKFSNRLTSSQSEEILERAKVFDPELVDHVVQETEEKKKKKEANAITDAQSSRESSTSRASTPTGAPVRGQLKIDNFGSLSRVAPVAPPKPQLPKSQLELARERLNAKKAALSTGSSHRKTEHDATDESDDDGEDAYSLFNLKKPNQKAGGITVLEDKWSQQRRIAQEKKKEEENSRLRLHVDLKPLYKRVLMWSFMRDDPYPDSELSNLKTVIDKFKTADDYIKTFEPLLLVECWSAILSAKNREDYKPMMISIGSKSSVGDFFEVFCSISRTELNTMGFTESDLVVLAYSDKELTYVPKVSDVKKSTTSCLGKIQEIKFVKGERADITIRVSRTGSLNSWLTPHSTLLLMRIMQMTTIEREFSSLHGLRYYNLSKQIFEATANPSSTIPQKDIENIRATYKVNDSQANAIGCSVGTEGFSLIQGPPGTGKTKTILGIIGYMLSTFKAPNAIAIPQGQKTMDSLKNSKSRKVLVCAPSNAAVDELVIRMKDGIMNSRGEQYTPKLVRLGRTDAINSAVKDMTLEELVDSQLGKPSAASNNMDGLFKELSEVKKQIEICKAKIADEKNPASDEVYKEKRELTKKANLIKQKMDTERETQNSNYRSREINRRNLQAKILGEADIICSTLSGSAHDMVANLGIKFDSVIIDEACQCTELSAVIPLRYGCRRCIMVGDPNQLPPTVISTEAANALYDQSLFVRMAKNMKPLLLNVQYRMNSAISKFSSEVFYNGELHDGPENDQLTKRIWHENSFFPPFRFYDIIEGHQIQNQKTFSYTNEIEVKIAVELINTLFTLYRNVDFKNKIGIITPYKEQNRLLQRIFINQFGNSIKKEITFNTVDGFQGQEKEIIIMSCVRADPSSRGVGFLRDFRRMNVALTRSKCSLWILGNRDSLTKNELWRKLINDADSRGCFYEAKLGFTRANGITKDAQHRKITDVSNSLDETESKRRRKSGFKDKKPKLDVQPGDDLTVPVPVNPSHTQFKERLNTGTGRGVDVKASAPPIPNSNSTESNVSLEPNSNGVLPPPSSTGTSTTTTVPSSSGIIPRPTPQHNAPSNGPRSMTQPQRSGSLPPRPAASGSLPMKQPSHRRKPEGSIFIPRKRTKHRR